VGGGTSIKEIARCFRELQIVNLSGNCERTRGGWTSKCQRKDFEVYWWWGGLICVCAFMGVT